MISYSVSGDATAGDDYTSLSGTVTILAGQTSATIDVNVLDDAVLENTESVTVTLDAITSGDSEISIGTSDTATVNITDEDTATVSVFANDDMALEPSDGGQFTVTMNAVSDQDTVINYTVGGTATAGDDYTPLSGTVTILAGQTSATIDVSTLDDFTVEETETIVITLDSVSDSDVSIDAIANTATVNIADNDTSLVSLLANDDVASEPTDDGQFTVSLSNVSATDTIVDYSIGGTATSGTDFTALTGQVLILAGQSSATIDVSVVDDFVIESDETVELTLLSTDNAAITIDTGSSVDSITISDDDTGVVSIIETDTAAAEPGDDAVFTVSLSQVSDVDTVVSYTVSGTASDVTDFNSLSGTVTILAGQTMATIDISVIDDSVLEANENVIVTLTSTDNSSINIDAVANQASATIADDDTAEVTITAIDATAAEPSDDGQFLVSISNPSDTDTVLSYVVAGDAVAGTDYVALSGTVTVLAGETTATIDVSVIDDNLLEDNETVSVMLTSIDSGDSDITIGTSNSATVTIADEDLALVSVTASDPVAGEPSDSGQFTISMSNPSDEDTTITYVVTGTATAGSDYVSLLGTAVITAGSTSVDVDVTVLDDVNFEANETVVLTVTATDDPDVSVDGSNNAATVTIADDDNATVSITANDNIAAEPTDGGQYTVTLSEVNDVDTIVTYVVAGTATSGDDYVSLPGTVTILAGELTATIDLSVIDNDILEQDETVVVTLTSTDDAFINVAPGASTATINIADDDTATVAITATDDTASEPRRRWFFHRHDHRRKRHGHYCQLRGHRNGDRWRRLRFVDRQRRDPCRRNLRNDRRRSHRQCDLGKQRNHHRDFAGNGQPGDHARCDSRRDDRNRHHRRRRYRCRFDRSNRQLGQRAR